MAISKSDQKFAVYYAEGRIEHTAENLNRYLEIIKRASGPVVHGEVRDAMKGSC